MDNNKKLSKLTDWSNEPTYDDLHSDYLLAKTDHNIYLEKLAHYRLLLEGGKKIKPAANRSDLNIKLVKQTLEWRYPAMEDPLLNTPNMFDVKPRTFEDAEAARRNALVLNYQWTTKVDRISLVNRVVRNFEDEGTVIVKTGWNVEEMVQLVDEEQPIFGTPEESVAILQEKVANGEMSAEEAQRVMTSGQPMQVGTQMVEVEKEVLVANHPTYEVRDNDSIIIDPTCGDSLEDARFIIDEFDIDMHTLKKDEVEEIKLEDGSVEITGKYHNLDFVKFDEDDGDSEPIYDKFGHRTTFKFEDNPRKKLKAYEYWGYWDINGDSKLVPIIGTWVGNVLIRLEENPFPHRKLPYSIASNMPLRNSVRGEPTSVLLEEHQDQLSKYSRAVVDMTSTNAVGQTFINNDLFVNRTERTNYEAGRTASFRNGMDPRRDIYKTPVAPIDQNIIHLMQKHREDAEAMSGTKSFSGGISGSALGSTATGIRSAMDATAKRELSSLRRLGTHLFTDLGRKTVIMNQQYLSEEETIRITNMEFVPVRREDLAGEFDLIVDISTPEKDNETAETLAFMAQTGASSMDPMMVNKIWAKVADLRKQPDLAQEFRDAKPPAPSEEQVKMQQIQMQTALLEQEKIKMEMILLSKQVENYDTNIAEKESRIKENSGDADEARANAELKRAQAEKLKSETDLLDMEHLAGKDSEEVAENKHQREIEKLHTQELYKNKGQK